MHVSPRIEPFLDWLGAVTSRFEALYPAVADDPFASLFAASDQQVHEDAVPREMLDPAPGVDGRAGWPEAQQMLDVDPANPLLLTPEQVRRRQRGRMFPDN